MLMHDVLTAKGKMHSRWIPKFKDHNGWEFGDIFHEHLRSGYHAGPEGTLGWPLDEVVAMCFATKKGVKGRAVAKIRYHWRLKNELDCLKYFTRNNGSCVPKLLAEFDMIQSGRGAVQGGFAKIIVMQEVPGRNLEDFPNLDIDDRDRVRVAFSRAIREFFHAGFWHLDAARRNLIWDKDVGDYGKCYIVDLEDVKTHASAKFCPARDWRNWDIAGPVEKVVDPMVPPYKPYIIDPDDVTVQQMAVRAKGKPLRKDTY